ncbi:MAG: hypothetical protein CML30_00195 [Rhizobiales bacterium]|nr:hypothetical protein [Hoeflea sp.]MBA67266.1 hypothetical protein [Hyphomicrobiales bacterium]|tara:strand:- start:359 stop:589 length:231 start_codon:yes stop_codon:yes gene_type:complete
MGQFSMEISWATGSVLGGNQHADFFYRHLVDGDAASNPLGWRWAAGIHTRGKLRNFRVPIETAHYSCQKIGSILSI